MPQEWLEWVLCVLLGFLVMEFVRYAINRDKYETWIANIKRGETRSTEPDARR